MTLHHDALRNRACLIVHGPDKAGLVAAVTALITRNQGNIVTLDQYSDNPQGGAFFQRVVFNRPNLTAAMPEIEVDLTDTLTPYGMEWTLTDQSVPKRMAILASTSDHCLLELLWRHRRGELPVDDPDGDLQPHRTRPRTSARSASRSSTSPTRAGQIRRRSDRSSSCSQGNVDLVVLARYMQILLRRSSRASACPVINIHHSFLPAFIGAAPYQKAKERGVKLVGATAHYVTADLDEGPIIEQDVARVNHATTPPTCSRRGAYVERAVLSRAVQWHAEDRVIRHGNHTIVFT